MGDSTLFSGDLEVAKIDQRCPDEIRDSLSRAIEMPEGFTDVYFLKTSAKTILAVGLLWLAQLSNAVALPLVIGPHKDVTVEKGAEGVTSITVSGHSPHFWSAPVPAIYDPDTQSVLAFEYFAPSGFDALSVRMRQADGSMRLAGSAEVPLAETWQPFSIVLSDPGELAEEMRFHFSLDGKIGSVLQLRKLEVRAPNAEELASETEREALLSKRKADGDAYLQYLRDWYPNEISSVEVGAEKVTVKGHASRALTLTELGPEQPSHSAVGGDAAAIDLMGDFELSFTRFASESDHDRALSRWRLDLPNGTPASLARWPDNVDKEVSRDLPNATAATQKGLGGMPNIGRDDHEIFELGIGHATVNFVLDALLSDTEKKGLKPYEFEGSSYYFNPRFLEGKEETVSHLNEQEIVVTCILLVSNRAGSGMAHPEAERRGVYSMPNLATPEGAKYYRAAIQFLMERFSQPGTRIANWVIHNEVDQAGTWTNMGAQPLARYLESYMRSARIVYHTARMFDPHARVFISLTHHWTKPGLGAGVYMVREMLDLFAEMAAAEGDFEWGVAYHPYPQNLRDPDAWDDPDPTMDFDTPYITPKNLEVLPAYLAQSRFLYRGEDQRAILFSEQGFNTPTLSEEDQKRQVAGLIYTFRKLREMPTVEAYHLHRYQDMPDREGGLRLGIIDENGNRKLGWNAYAALGTEDEAEFAKIADAILPESGDVTAVKQSDQPNIVLILADDLGWSDTTPYQGAGENFYETPSIAALAKRGMLFDNAYAASPLCSPTRASILTGQYPGRIRLTTPACHVPQVVLDPGLSTKASPSTPVIEAGTRTRFPNFYQTFPELLKQDGYETAFVGKWHLGRAPYFPDQQGFDRVIGGREHPGPPGGFFAPWPIDTIPESPEGSHIDDVITTESIKWMEAQVETGEPFFLNLWYYSVHAPFQAKPELIEKYREKAKTLSQDAPRRNPVMAAMIETMDENIGRIVDTLDRLGVADNTLLVFTSDNGGNEYNYAAGELATNNHPLANGKGNILDGGQRVPFIASWPGQIAAGSTNEGLVSSVDLFPTFLDAAGLSSAPAQPVDGISLLPTFLGEEPIDSDRAIFCHFPHSPPATGTRAGTSVRRGPYKLTRYFADGPEQKNRFVLIDTSNDPGESNNLAKEKPQLTSQLDRAIGQNLRETESIIPIPNPAYKPSVLGWEAGKTTQLQRGDTGLVVIAPDTDPQLRTSDFSRATGSLSLIVEMEQEAPSDAVLYWSTKENSGIGKDRMLPLTETPEGWRVDFDIGDDRLSQLRFDPAKRKGATLIRSIRLIEWKEPGEGKTVRLWDF